MVASPPLERLPEAKTVDDVVDNLDRIIRWSIDAPSSIGYFAVLYKRSTLAVRAAIEDGKFQNGPRMEKFDALFAQRYFHALNAYFYPDEYRGPTPSWEVALVGHADSQTTMIQQMMTGLNAHICFDLGVSAAAIAPDSLDTLEHDFNLINALVVSQVPGMLDVFQDLSPVFRRLRSVVPNWCEIWLIKRVLIKFREAAWLFAIYLATYPDKAREKRVNQSVFVAALGAWYLQPPGKKLFPYLVRLIAKHESRDVAANLKAFDSVMNNPEQHAARYM